MIVITGAAGFIGSVMTGKLNREKYLDLVLVDDFSRTEKHMNYAEKTYSGKIDRNEFFAWMDKNHRFIQFVIHLGARTDTAEFDKAVFYHLNYEYSVKVWEACVSYGIPLIYASSAATYGSGEMGYSDSHELIPYLKSLNPYGESKNNFDKWVISQDRKPWFWTGLKFFNVFGPNEYHKGRMSSVIFHAYNQIKDTGKMKLFRSNHPDFSDGEQRRDFIYVMDVVEVIFYLMKNRKYPGIYNLGTGQARTFNDLVKAVFTAMGIPPQLEYIDTPEDIRDKYQYFTQAEMGKLRSAGFKQKFTTLEEGIHDYIKNYLADGNYY